MTCIITILTPDKIVISADSAVSSDSRTYTGIEKTIPLSNDPPMAMSMYGNSDFEDMPLVNIISEYIKKTDFTKVNTVAKVKEDFLEYVHNIMPKETVDEYLDKKLILFKKDIKKFDANDLKYYSLIDYEKTTLPIFDEYNFDFSDVIPEDFSDDGKRSLNMNLNNIFLSSISEELSGIVIIGIDKITMKNGYAKFEMLFNGKNNVLICNEEEKIDINKTEFKVFAQNDVINGFFNGIDETLLYLISKKLQNASHETLEILLSNLKNKTNISKMDLEKISEEITFIKENSIISQEFDDSIKNIEINTMETILHEIEIMPKYEVMKMNETLINLTRLKRIITSEQITVDGEVKHFVLSLKNGIEKFY